MDHRKIKRLRENLKLSQQQAADASGLNSRQHWNNIESGRQDHTSISVELLERIAKTLGVHPSDLIS